MAQIDVVGGIAAGADLSPDDASFRGGSPAAWALRWFIIAAVFLLLIALANGRR